MAHQSGAVTAFVTSLSPEPKAHHNKPEEHPPDNLPSEMQPPGVDDPEYQSLEEALLGE